MCLFYFYYVFVILYFFKNFADYFSSNYIENEDIQDDEDGLRNVDLF